MLLSVHVLIPNRKKISVKRYVLGGPHGISITCSSLGPLDILARNMMTSPNRNIFRVTGPLCGEFTGHRWIPLTKASDAELWCFLWSVPWINGWVNIREAGDLRRHRAHYDVIVVIWIYARALVLHGIKRAFSENLYTYNILEAVEVINSTDTHTSTMTSM